jgi:hypothetical protein
MTRLPNELACPCGAIGHVFGSERGHHDCIERVVEPWGEFDHRRVPGVPIGETFEVTCLHEPRRDLARGGCRPRHH